MGMILLWWSGKRVVFVLNYDQRRVWSILRLLEPSSTGFANETSRLSVIFD